MRQPASLALSPLTRPRPARWIALPLAKLAACAGDPDPGVKQGQAGDDTAADTADTGAVPEGCRADGGDANKSRTALISLPYTRSGGQSDAWAAWSLSGAGELQPADQTFPGGRATTGEAVFTPDGQLALAPLEDGGLMLFDAEAGTATALAPDLYAERIVMHPSGASAWIVDGNWPENGGGIYPVDIACDAPEIEVGRRWISAKLPADLLPLPDGRFLVAGREVAGADEDADIALISAEGDLLSSADAFGDNDAIVSDAALTLDGRYALLADISEFSGVPTRVAIVELSGDDLTPVQILDVEDPIALLTAPDDDRVIVVSGYANALRALERTGDDQQPFRLSGEPDYLGASPQLPGAAAMIRRGDLRGRLLVAEVEGVHQFDTLGGLTDLGLTATGGVEGIVGAVGVQP